MHTLLKGGLGLCGVVLLMLGTVGLLIGWLGDTVWTPTASHTATVELSGPGAAVVIDPGVVYVGGEEGTMTVEGDTDMAVMTASPKDATAYLEGVPHTAITGVPTWDTLKAEKRHTDGKQKLSNPAKSDLWTPVVSGENPAQVNISKLASAERDSAGSKSYRSIVIVTDGKQPAASSVTIAWSSQSSHAWVPFAYALGAFLAVLGLILLLFTVVFSKRQSSDTDPEEDNVELDLGEYPGSDVHALTGAAAGEEPSGHEGSHVTAERAPEARESGNASDIDSDVEPETEEPATAPRFVRRRGRRRAIIDPNHESNDTQENS